MAEKTRTEAEIRAAFEKSGRCMETLYDFDLMMAELFPDEIHPDVPVMYAHDIAQGWADEQCVSLAAKLPKDATNIRVLILVNTAREIARRTVESYVKSGLAQDVMADIDDQIADYTSNGLGGEG